VSHSHDFIEESRKEWSSESAFVASMAGAAVGLGNLWRFPYIMGENGGGAFVGAYLIALIVVVLLWVAITFLYPVLATSA
jgi:NSS family neurotransmitter:Na+ symporter